MYSNLWIQENYQDQFTLGYKIQKTCFSGKSAFQHIDVVETELLGKMLLNDGLVMVTEKDEFIYHDMITHVPLFVHPNPENILIIGGGDGGTAREVLRHKKVKKCTMVEIDKMVVDVCKEFIPQTSCDLGHEKLDLIIEDGVKFVEQTKDKFDVIIVDSTDPIGPAQPLFGPEFYQNIKKCLNTGGIVVSQGESPFYQVPMQQVLLKALNDSFSHVYIYNFSNLTYPGGLWSFTFASDGYDPVKDLKIEQLENSQLKFGYYNQEVHKASFCLPNFQRKNLAGLIRN